MFLVDGTIVQVTRLDCEAMAVDISSIQVQQLCCQT